MLANFDLRVPEIIVSGNGLEIPDGNATPTIADNTDFGSIDFTAGEITKTFAIVNNGTSALNLTGTPHVNISGQHADDFSIGVQPISPVGVEETTTFEVSFDPSAEGLREAVITIANDDDDENPYDFTIQGTGIAPDTDGDGLSDIQEQGSCNRLP